MSLRFGRLVRGDGLDTEQLTDAQELLLQSEWEGFMKLASDQIGTPVAAIARLAELLGDRARDSSAAARSRMIDLIIAQALETEHIVKDVFAVSHLNAKDLTFNSEVIDLREVVDAAVERWGQAQKVRLTVTGDLPTRADFDWTTHIVSDLLRNAVALGGEQIEVRIADGFNKVVLEVADDGLGVNVDDHETIFEPSYKGRSATFGTSSLGLGLSAARGLARAMGGDVRYYREHESNVFELSLPRLTGSTGRRGQLPDIMIDPSGDRPTHDSVRELLSNGGPTMVYQPIVDMRSGRGSKARIVGYESLARFPKSNPGEWFETAGSAGIGIDLELAAIQAGVEGFTTDVQEHFLSLNLSDPTLISTRLNTALGQVDPSRIVFELSESARVSSYQATRRAIDALRERGVRLAVDDVGADEIDLWHILRLEPDIIKIDRHLVADQDHVRRNDALIRGITTMANDMGIMVVAEAVETEKEEQRLVGLGVPFGQGYLFGKPRPLMWKSKILDATSD